MKTVQTFLLATGMALGLASCASNEASTWESSRAARHHEAIARDTEEGSRPPRIGMSKDQVLNLYGEPANISNSPHGEVWLYVFNNFDGRIFIPYYGAIHDRLKRRNSGTVVFDSNGRVRDFNWNQSNPMGATIWR